MISAIMLGACASERTYLSKSSDECQTKKFHYEMGRLRCEQGKTFFLDDTGCGCEKHTEAPIDGKLKAYDCIADQRDQPCTKEYMPVCGQVQIQCITTPCDPIKQTFGNKCMACANSLTISYTEGACEKDLAGGTVPVGGLEEQCTSIGGAWTGFDCTGISAEQCQEIGGEFDECASACRNNPAAELCTMQCVQVCRVRI